VPSCQCSHSHRLHTLVRRLEQSPKRIDGTFAHRGEGADVRELDVLVLLRLERRLQCGCGSGIFYVVECPRRHLANAWLRMKHHDYDTLRGMLDFVGRTLKVRAS